MVLVFARRLESRSKYKQAVRFASSMSYRLKCYFSLIWDDFACLRVHSNNVLDRDMPPSDSFLGTA
jgi:hypothetical protein